MKKWEVRGEADSKFCEIQGRSLKMVDQPPPLTAAPASAVSAAGAVELQEERRNPTSDPYYAARDELKEAVEELQRDIYSWQQQQQQRNKNSATAAAVAATANSLRHSTEELLEELATIEKSVVAAEKHPLRFQLSSAELQQRKTFVAAQYEILNSVKQQLLKSEREAQQRAAAAIATAHKEAWKQSSQSTVADQNYSLLSIQQRQHQDLLFQQDVQLEELSESADRLHETARVINRELETQQKILNELDEDIEQQTTQMNFLMRKMARLLRTSNMRQLCLIIWLFCLMMFLLLLLIVT